MKKIILTSVSLLFFLVQSFGQIDFGVKAGLNIANVNYGEDNNTPRIGFNAGFLSQYNISKKYFVEAGLSYSVKGYSDVLIPDGTATISLNYITIPLSFGFRPSDKFSFLLGPEFGFLTTANSSFDNSNHDITSNFQKFDLGLDIAATYNFNRKSGVEIRYNYGFKDLVKGTFVNSSGTSTGITETIGSNRVFQINFFYILSK
jgi:Outer membrane protein beta-barrel domain